MLGILNSIFVIIHNLCVSTFVHHDRTEVVHVLLSECKQFSTAEEFCESANEKSAIIFIVLHWCVGGD